MRKVANYEKIIDVSTKIDEKCAVLEEKKNDLLKELTILGEIDKTPVIDRLITQYQNSIKEIDTICEGFRFYTKYMSSVGKIYNGLYDDFKSVMNKFELLEDEDEQI